MKTLLLAALLVVMIFLAVCSFAYGWTVPPP